MKKSRKVNHILSKSAKALLNFIDNAYFREIDLIRVARSIFALLISGCSISNTRIQTAVYNLIKVQRPDGGWADPSETAWAVGAIESVKGSGESSLELAYHWLQRNRIYTGGWGHHNRDQARIPVTALIATLVPDVVKPEDITWISNEWQRDFEGPVRLSYKAGFFLLAVPEGYADALAEQTIEHLFKDQNEDGGFGPWRNHPIGSDPWSTGVVLWGLSRWIGMVDKAVIQKAMSWLEKTQLPSGYWPYHYLDDGTSFALIGAVAAMKAQASVD